MAFLIVKGYTMRFKKTAFCFSLAVLLSVGTSLSASSHYDPPANPNGPVGVTGTTNLTRSQAIQIATQFCQNVGGFTLAPDVEADFPKESTTGCWMNCWRVTFKGQAVVEIDDISGYVTFYAGPQVPQSAPAGPAISQADAVAKAALVLQASGITGVDPTPYANAPQETSYMSPNGGATVLPSASGHEWTIVYTRMFGQIPYAEHTIDVTLQAETGILNSFCVHYRSPAPTSDTVNLTAEQAANAAWNQINSTTIQNAVMDGGSLAVIQPNRFYEPSHEEEPLPGPGKVAYICSFTYQGFDGGRHFENGNTSISEANDYLNFGQSETHVWVYVDAGDGSILGGGISQMKGVTAPSTLPQKIADAREIKIVAKNKRGQWDSQKPVAVLSEADNRKWFHQVKGLKSFAPRPFRKGEKQVAALKLVLVSKAGGSEQEVFYLDEGKIGKPVQQAAVSPELKKWLASIAQKQIPLAQSTQKAK